MRAQVATLNKMTINSHKGQLDRYFTLDTLFQLSKTAPGRPITIGFNGPVISIVTKSEVDIENGFVYIYFDEDLYPFLDNFIVPGFKTTTTKGEIWTTIRCMDFAITNLPVDKTLKTIRQSNEELDEISEEPKELDD